MRTLVLFLGDSEIDTSVRQLLEQWIAATPDITLKCEDIHQNPISVVRLGITELPALVLEEEILAQGPPEKWVLPLLDWIFASGDTPSG
jgi:hypothetical protein